MRWTSFQFLSRKPETWPPAAKNCCQVVHVNRSAQYFRVLTASQPVSIRARSYEPPTTIGHKRSGCRLLDQLAGLTGQRTAPKLAPIPQAGLAVLDCPRVGDERAYSRS